MSTDQIDKTDELREMIAAHRRENAERRARAFVDCPERVLGMAVKPVTPATWTMLHATGSRFLGAQTPLEGDIRNFLWFHSWLYQPVRWWSVATFAKWIALLPFNARLHMNRDVDFYAAVLAMAINDINRILGEALADAPAAGNREGAPAGACLEAQLIHLFTSQYGWSEEKIRSTPIAKLLQYRRCFDSSEDEDESERLIRFEHLRRRNAELKAQRAANEPKPQPETD